MAKTREYSLLASAARATSENGAAVDVSHSRDLNVVLYVTAITTAPTSLDVTLQTSYDGTNFVAFGTAINFTQVTTATGLQSKQITNFGGKWIRAVATIVGGTGKTYTFSVLAHGKD